MNKLHRIKSENSGSQWEDDWTGLDPYFGCLSINWVKEVSHPGQNFIYHGQNLKPRWSFGVHRVFFAKYGKEDEEDFETIILWCAKPTLLKLILRFWISINYTRNRIFFPANAKFRVQFIRRQKCITKPFYNPLTTAQLQSFSIKVYEISGNSIGFL